MNHFETALVLRPNEDGSRWMNDAEFVYFSDTYGEIKVPKGFECDLNSLPRLAWIVSPKTDYPRSGLVHDWLYRGRKVPRSVADAVYREALQVEGLGRVRAFTRWAALRAFGWYAYNSDTDSM